MRWCSASGVCAVQSWPCRSNCAVQRARAHDCCGRGFRVSPRCNAVRAAADFCLVRRLSRSLLLCRRCYATIGLQITAQCDEARLTKADVMCKPGSVSSRPFQHPTSRLCFAGDVAGSDSEADVAFCWLVCVLLAAKSANRKRPRKTDVRVLQRQKNLFLQLCVQIAQRQGLRKPSSH